MSVEYLIQSMQITWVGEIANFPPSVVNFDGSGLEKLVVFNARYLCPFCGFIDLKIKGSSAQCTNCHSRGCIMLLSHRIEAEPESEET